MNPPHVMGKDMHWPFRLPCVIAVRESVMAGKRCIVWPASRAFKGTRGGGPSLTGLVSHFTQYEGASFTITPRINITRLLIIHKEKQPPKQKPTKPTKTTKTTKTLIQKCLPSAHFLRPGFRRPDNTLVSREPSLSSLGAGHCSKR